MTVAELRKALEGLPDDAPVVYEYDGGILFYADEIRISKCSPDPHHVRAIYGDAAYDSETGVAHLVIS